MKRLLLLFLVISIFSLAGCVGKQGTSGDDQAPSGETEATVEETAKTMATTTATMTPGTPQISRPLRMTGTTSLMMVDKEKFRIQLPADWVENSAASVPWDLASSGAAAWSDDYYDDYYHVADVGGYDTRMSISYQYLGDQTFENRLNVVKANIRGLYPDAAFAERTPINGHPGRVFEGNYKLDETGYRIFVFLLAGKDVSDSGKIRDAYMISFQTIWLGDIESKLTEFNNIVDSFEIK
jgi:hypothetical protein